MESYLGLFMGCIWEGGMRWVDIVNGDIYIYVYTS